MIQLTKSGVLVDDSTLRSLRSEFHRIHAIRLPQLLDSAVLGMLMERMARGSWLAQEYEGVGRDLVLQDAAAVDLLHFVANIPQFLHAVEEITDIRPLVRFDGRVYRMEANVGHSADWHDDGVHDRQIGMSINLSAAHYRGGIFHLRRAKTGELIRQLPNVTPGDGILFRISPLLEHRVTDVEGETPKVAFAGWFYPSGVNFITAIRATSTPEIVNGSSSVAPL